ncbi:PET112 family, C terminal region domain-containing protein [Besnoitia besnoiti]|uniref:Glutamyl-tRNA(Gln) amidotransferase subunit B, mitochondrial n=1 Tax=Besnoitia besnoiti TaxID=94643 RepID=A0A2A9MQE9_BESBE|nr:PET112 family, C terminal region domain-containing protein [Besnoitia besnoiti]PFH38463.1 PET112 family, C terminal region domain-containing protein [Besnoitia besnoiti]
MSTSETHMLLGSRRDTLAAAFGPGLSRKKKSLSLTDYGCFQSISEINPLSVGVRRRRYSAREPPRSARFASRNKQICNTDNVAEDELEDASDGKGTSKRLEADEALKLETVVGLEAHVQLLTATKLFCACPSQVALTAAAAKLAPDLAARVTRFVASHLAADAADGCASARASPSPSLSSPPPGDFPSSLLAHVSSPPSVSSASASSSSSSASQPLSLWPNTFVCPVCLGEPGSLPTPSRAAVVAACKAALLLQCTDIPETLEFDRKCYIYPDLSKNYQISQIRWPIGRNGHIVLPSSGKHIRIRGVHLEEDTAKMLTATRAASASDAQRRGEGRRLSCRASLPVDALQGERDNVDEGLGSEVDGDEDAFLDMNRASLPLVEIVTEPDFRGADEAVEFLRELRLLFRSAGIATCVMSEGALRCDLNVSLRDTHTKKDFPRTEVKNVGSLRAVRKAIQFEALRQTALLESASTGGRSQTGSEFPASVERRCASSREEDADEGQSAHGLEAQTRMWDDRHQQTRKMRKKFLSEEYFPVRENLIPPVALPRALLDELRAGLTETPASRLTRYVSLGVPPYSARTLIRDPEVAAYFEEAVAGGAPAPAAAAWLLNEVAGWRRRRRSEASRARTERGRSARDSSGAAGRPNAGEADPRRASEAAAEAAEADGEDRTDTPAAPRTGAALLPLTQLKLTPRKFAEMLRLVEQGVLTHNVAKQLLPTLLFSWDGSVQELLEAIEGDREAPEAPAAESTAQEVERQAREILQASPELLQRFENGTRNMADFVVGKILKQQQAAAGRDVAARSGDRPEEIKATVLELMDALSARGRT